MMWTRHHQPLLLQCDYAKFALNHRPLRCSQFLNPIFEPQREKKTVSMMPNGLLKPEETCTEEEESQTERAFSEKTVLLVRAVVGHLQMCLLRCFGNFLCIWL
ncbi:hypothetical protein E3U43_019445 [Larimichthys crocea]|uniref:Uncharacterized protein n=1 Tax=Larimichthys crocea TaxID=215358 RepID=A0ACD3QTF5_LARCR|nr:hypothetical protein E3U43_019445 [Larimichthys crocea]